MHGQLALILTVTLVVAPLSGCIGVANMGELRAQLGDEPARLDVGTPTPEPDAPTPVIEVSPSAIRTGETVLFDGSGSTAADGRIDGWSWSVDGTVVSTASAFNWTFEAAGGHLVELTVRDGNLSATEERQVQVVRDRPPVAAVEVRRDGEPTDRTWVDEPVTLSGEPSRDPEGGEMTYAWRLGDGTEATGVTTEHAYDAPGRYAARLSVTDAVGQTARANASIVVDDRGSAEGRVTPSDGTARVPIPVAAGAGELTVTLRYEADLVLEDLDLALEGPEGETREAADDEGALPGDRSLTVAVDGPASGDWTAEIRLDTGDGADWQLDWTVRY